MLPQTAGLTLLILAGITSAARLHASVSEVEFSEEGEQGDDFVVACPICAHRHLRELAAKGADLEAWSAAVAANAAAGEESSSLLEAEEKMNPRWPWGSKLKDRAKVVGKGAFGQVYVAEVKCSGDLVAIKAMKASRKEVDEEAYLLKLFSIGSYASPHFVTYFDHGRGQDGRYYIMMEAALGGTLSKVIEGSATASREDKLQLFFDMVEGVAHMHQKHIVHRDLKPANIMISRSCGRSVPCHAKVVDLGLACCMGRCPGVTGIPRCRGQAGTPLYIAPETYARGTVDEKNDVWALGLMLYEIIFRNIPDPIARSNTLSHLERAVKSFRIERDRRFRALQDGFIKKLLKGMLSLDMRSRMTSASALQGARALVASFSDEDTQGSMDDCFFGGAHDHRRLHRGRRLFGGPGDGGGWGRPVRKPDPEDVSSMYAEGDVDFFTISDPKTDSTASFIFNHRIVDAKTGVVKDGLKEVEKYVVAPVKPGDIILEVNDKSWKSLSDTARDQCTKGVFGPLVFKFKKVS